MSNEVLVLVDHTDGNVKKVTTELLTLARRLGTPSAVLCGNGFDSARDRLAEFGAATVYVTEDAAIDAHPVAPKADVLAQLIAEKSPGLVLIASTAEGKEIAGRLAIRTGSGIVTDAIDVEGTAEAPVGVQSVFGGATVVKSTVKNGTPIITVRPERDCAGGGTRWRRESRCGCVVR